MGGNWWFLWGWLIGGVLTAAFSVAWDQKKGENIEYGFTALMSCFWPILVAIAILYGLWKMLVFICKKAIEIVESIAKSGKGLKKSNYV